MQRHTAASAAAAGLLCPPTLKKARANPCLAATESVPMLTFTPPVECDSPEICHVGGSCAGQFNTHKQCNTGCGRTPVLYVSPGQFRIFTDPEFGGLSGRYMPARKTPAGLFTQPLYASPDTSASKAAAIREQSLAMCVRTLAWALRRKDPESKAAAGALDLLRRYGLLGTVLRDVPADPQNNVPADSSTGAGFTGVGTPAGTEPAKSVPSTETADQGPQ